MGSQPVFLLGVDWAHLSTHGRVLQADKTTPVSGDHWVELNSGMMAVVPVWKLAELLTGDYP